MTCCYARLMYLGFRLPSISVQSYESKDSSSYSHPPTGQDTAPSVNALRPRSPTIKRLRNQRRLLTSEVFSLPDASHCFKSSFIFIRKIGLMDDGKCFYKSKANTQKHFGFLFWFEGPNPRKETYIFTSNTGSQKKVNLRKFEFKPVCRQQQWNLCV